METEKIGFFKRFKMAIFNLEKYSVFANERFSKALKYLAILVLLVTIVLAVASTIELSNEAGKAIDFFKSEEFPNFELKDGKLEADRIITSYDEEYNSSLIIDTTKEITDEKIDEYKKKVEGNQYSVILLNDKIIYNFGSTADTELNEGLETTYNNVTNMFGIGDITKDKFVKDYLNDDNLFKLKTVLFIYAYMTILLLNIINLLEDVIIIGLFGWIAAKISKVPLTLSKTMSLGIYSLTLSIILSATYSVVYSFTNFEIKYFEIMYMIIAYIYIVAAIMIMKEGNRTASDVVTVEGQVVKAENEEENQENKEDGKKDKNKKPDEKDKNSENEKMPENENQEKDIENTYEGKE